jgi:N-acyl-D-amino-acid deacylase
LADLIIRNGTVIDGTGTDRFRADVAVEGDRIVAVGSLGDRRASWELDAAGKIVAPGFIDVHNHSDGWLLREANFTPKTTQGFTTEVLMADGIGYAPLDAHTAREWLFYLRSLNFLKLQDYTGWRTIDDYLQALDGKSAQNSCVHIPYANLRSIACGFKRTFVDDFQMREIQRQIRIGMEAGAVGVSTGLDYIVQCFSTTDELVEAMTAMAPYDGLYVSHIRYKRGLLPALREAAEIGRRAGVRVHVSHLKAPDPQLAEQVFEFLEQARKDVDIAFDVYPYQPGSTMLSYLLPYEVWEDGPLAAMSRLNDPVIRSKFAEGLRAYKLAVDQLKIAWLAGEENRHLIGMSLAEFIAESGLSPADALIDLLIEERMAVLLVFHEGDDRLVHPFLQHDLFMLGSDGIFGPGGQVHPRVFGSAGRMLGPLVRDEKLFTLEEAVHRMTGRPADWFRLEGRGHVREGACADLVVFDPETVTDRATYENPQQRTAGIEEVLVNGVSVVHQGEPVLHDTPPGRALRKTAAK